MLRAHYSGAGVFRMSHPGEQSGKTMEDGSSIQSHTKKLRGCESGEENITEALQR